MKTNRSEKCPRCTLLARHFDEHFQALLINHYGKVSAEEYEALRQRVAKLNNPHRQGIGTLSMSYEATVVFQPMQGATEVRFDVHLNCARCGLHFSKVENLPVDDVEPSLEAVSTPLREAEATLGLLDMESDKS